MKKLYIYILFFIVLISIANARSDVEVYQGQYYIGTDFQDGFYLFNFTIFDDELNGNQCYSVEDYLSTGNWGEWKAELTGIHANCNDITKDYFLEITIDYSMVNN